MPGIPQAPPQAAQPPVTLVRSIVATVSTRSVESFGVGTVVVLLFFMVISLVRGTATEQCRARAIVGREAMP